MNPEIPFDIMQYLPDDPISLGPSRPKYAVVPVYRLEDRVGRVFRAVTIGMMDPAVRLMMTDLYAAAGCPQRGFQCELETAFWTLKERIKYRRDPGTVDLFPTLRRAIRAQAADCGGMTDAIMTALGVTGFPVGCRVIAQGPDWDHIFGLAEVPGPDRRGTPQRIMALDLSEPRFGPGDEPNPSTYRQRADFWYPAEVWAEWFMRGANDSALPPIIRSV